MPGMALDSTAFVNAVSMFRKSAMASLLRWRVKDSVSAWRIGASLAQDARPLNRAAPSGRRGAARDGRAPPARALPRRAQADGGDDGPDEEEEAGDEERHAIAGHEGAESGGERVGSDGRRDDRPLAAGHLLDEGGRAGARGFREGVRRSPATLARRRPR